VAEQEQKQQDEQDNPRDVVAASVIRMVTGLTSAEAPEQDQHQQDDQDQSHFS
jgi:hypothetical protein